MVKIYTSNSNITANKTDSVVDFPQLVIKQMDRCNLALSQGAFQFSTAVLAFSCTLAHLRQRDDWYKKDMDTLSKKHKSDTEAIKDKKNSGELYQGIQMRTSIKEYEALVRLCARHSLFPNRRGELDDDDD